MMDGWVGGEEEMYKLGLLKTHLANTKSAFRRGRVSCDVGVYPFSHRPDSLEANLPSLPCGVEFANVLIEEAGWK